MRIKELLPLRFWQVIGAIGIIAAYTLFVLKHAILGWVVLTAIVGVAELIAIFAYRGTITRFWRNIYGVTLDRIVLFSLIPLTWWLAGELAAGFFLMGLLNSHFHEHE